LKPRIAVAALIASLAVLGLVAMPAAAVAPVVAIEDATEVAYTTAVVKGEVNPEGQSTVWRLQYSTQADFSSDVHTVEEETTESGTPVQSQLTGLTPGTTYYARLQAENADGTVEDVTTAFETKAVAAPTISNFAIASIASEGAHLEAEVDPNGTDPAFDAEWHFECTPTCKGLAGGTVPAGATGDELKVANDATGLLPHTFYTVTVFATNKGGTAEKTKAFQTGGAGPLVASFAAGPVQSDRVMLNGEVDPRGSATVYWFEWGTEDCSQPGAGCQSIPAERDASAGDGSYYRWVQRQLTGLSPSTTYHFRLVAENEHGTTEGPDETFTTAAPEPSTCPNEALRSEQQSTYLGNCRAYEMVSPPDKNGAEVIPQTDKTHVATDGDAVTFASLGGFGGLSGSTADFEYLSRRSGEPGTNGWSTHGINPLHRAGTFPAYLTDGNNTTFENGFAPDLSSAIYRTWRPLTAGSNTAEVSNLYRVDNLGTAAESVQLLTDSTSPLPDWFSNPEIAQLALLNKPKFAGASTDLGHVAFESPLDLTADAPSYPLFCGLFGLGCPMKLYDNDNGTVHLVGRIPSSGSECDDSAGSPDPCVAAESSQAALSANYKLYSERAISADGRRIYFQSPEFVEAGPIYLREDGIHTEQVTAEGKFWDASRDGSRAFFSTSEQLLPEDTDGAPDLYMFEPEAPPGSRLTLISIGSAGSDGYFEQAIGASADGHYVYFVSDGELIAGGPPDVFMGVYVWHDGQLKLIGNLPGINVAKLSGPRVGWQVPEGATMGRVSPDGRHLLFMSNRDKGLVGFGGFGGYEHQGFQEFYLYDADSGRLACASCNPSGKAGVTDAVLGARKDAGSSAITGDGPQALSEDGRYVFFSSGDALVPQDTNGLYDAYEYDSVTGEVHLLSSGTEHSPSYVLDASPDGRDAYIATRQRLLGWDHDESYDLYDARVDGGFPEPAPEPAACTGDSCRSGVNPAPAAPTAASQNPGEGNPRPRCPKGKRRVGGRCVKKHHRHHRKQQSRRRAGADRRTAR